MDEFGNRRLEAGSREPTLLHPRYNHAHAFQHLPPFSLFTSPHLQTRRKTRAPPPPPPPPEQHALSHEGQDAIDQQGHDGSAEQASHRHGDEPGQEDVPEEAPVHRLLGADPAHGHDRAHLEVTKTTSAAARGGGGGPIWPGEELQVASSEAPPSRLCDVSMEAALCKLQLSSSVHSVC